MNKKQGVIIVTLLVLIICAGFLATKVNSPLYVNGTEMGTGEGTTFVSKDSKKKGTDYFTEAKLARNQENNTTIETLKSIINEKDASQASKDNAAKESTKIATNELNEKKVESALQGKGYEDAVCRINEDGKAIITIKAKENLNDQQAREIKNTAMNIVKVKTVEIEVHQ